MLKLFLKEYLGFSKKERTGIFVLLVLIVLLIVIPFFFPPFIQQQKFDHHQFEKEIVAFEQMQAESTSTVKGKIAEEENFSSYDESAVKRYTDQSKERLFDFDPNTLTTEGWRQLGLRDKTIQTIQNYLSKGGKFDQPEDIKRIWGIHQRDVQRLIPYIKIKERYKQFENKQPSINEFTANKRGWTINKNTPIDINTADTTAFISLPGIGSKLAGRIVAFRDNLGGFYKIEQVAETFGLRDSTYQQIKSRLILNDPTIKRLNINSASVDEMRSHPYLRYALANAIVQYRTQHGSFTTITDIKIMLITEDVFNKIAPYLEVE